MDKKNAGQPGQQSRTHAVLVLETILGSDTSTHDPVGVALDEAVADGALSAKISKKKSCQSSVCKGRRAEMAQMSFFLRTLTSVDTSKVDSSQARF